MRRLETGGTVFYQPEAMGRFPDVQGVVTTRHGGVSPPPFDSLNLSISVGDDQANVDENWARLHSALGLDPTATVDARQAQAGQVALVNEAQRGTRIAQVDALITNVPDIPLLLRFADCVPIMFYDPVHRAIGIAHSGWRGTMAKVVGNAVLAMTEAFGSKPSELFAFIGPSIGPCCYEVGAEVRARVEQAFPEVEGLLIPNHGSVHLDLWEANARLLRQLGVEDVEVAGICTADNTGDFYSWRRERAKTGRFAALVALTGQKSHAK